MLKSNWKLERLDKVLKVVRGSSPRPIKNFITDDIKGVNWIKIGDVGENEKYVISTKEKITLEGAERSRFVDVGDFIFSNSMSFGRAYIMKIPGYIHDGWFTFKLPPELDSHYLWYLFKSPYLIEQIKQLASGAIVQNISSDLVKKCLLPIPPLEEQRTIVAKLDQAFAAIDQAKANIEKNIANAKELFQSKLNQIFSQKGDGWEEKKLGEVVQFTNGRNQKEVLDVNGEYPILGSAGNIMGYATNFLCEKGTVIIGRKGNISKPLFIDFKFWNVDTAFGLFPKNKIMLPKFNYYVCLNIDFASHNKGTTIPSLVKSDLIEIKVSYPISLEIQQQIVTQLDQLQEQSNLLVTKYQQKLVNLEELKKSILEKAFKGELSTKEIEKV